MRLPNPVPFHQLGRLSRQVAARVRNQVTAAGFSDRASRNGMVPNDAIALFFAVEPENLYQFEQWRRPLEELARTRPVFVIVDRSDTGERVLESTTLPVTLARGSAALEEIVSERGVRVVLYVNQVEANFRMLRFAGPVHIQLGHGESDKISSASNQHKAYDLTFVGGPAGRDRLGQALRGYDAERRTVLTGRPQLDYEYPGAPAEPRSASDRWIWYAPTWEGDRPSISYGSLVSHGVAMVTALLAEPSVRVIYRPHPRTGMMSTAHAEADADHPAHAGRSPPPGGYRWLRLAVGLRRRLHHRHLRGGLRLAGHRKAAGHHRAGAAGVRPALAAAGRARAAVGRRRRERC